MILQQHETVNGLVIVMIKQIHVINSDMLKQNTGNASYKTYTLPFKSGYLKRIQRYCSHIESSDLLPYRAGIRAQAVNADGTLEHDFVFVQTQRCLHVGNAPSPAATSALPIAAAIVAKL